MSPRNISFIIMGALGVCAFSTGCKELSTQNQGVGGAPAWWNDAWQHRIRITFQNAGGESLNNFPAMIRLDASRFPNADPSSSGADLRFIDSDGQTVLSHEIDGWNSNGDSFVWVNVPTIDATNTDHIWLYYGNPMAPEIQNSKAVWNDFVGVYHLSLNSTPPHFLDSTGTMPGQWNNSNTGMVVPGQVNGAIELNGIAYIRVGDNNNVAANPGEARTVEVWAKPSLAAQQHAIVHEEGQCVGWALGTTFENEYIGSFLTSPAMPLCSMITDHLIKTQVSPMTWRYLTLVIDRPGLKMSLFVDGLLTTSTTIDNTNIADGNGLFHIGSDYDGGSETFIGSLDEVRVSNSARSPGWIAAQHKSMTDQFIVFQVE